MSRGGMSPGTYLRAAFTVVHLGIGSIAARPDRGRMRHASRCNSHYHGGRRPPSKPGGSRMRVALATPPRLLMEQRSRHERAERERGMSLTAHTYPGISEVI